MTDTRTTARRIRRRRKAGAIASAGLALRLAAIVSLAAWTDSEWVFGGTGPGGTGDEGVGTSTFEVQQNAWTGTAPTTASTFTDHEANPGNALVFDVDPSGLTPGDTIYAPVALTTTAASVAGTLQLTAPVAAAGHTAVDVDDLLWNNLTYQVKVTDSAATAASCTAAGFAAAGTDVVPAGTLLTAAITPATQLLSAARGNVQYYCFAITLPDNATTQTLQGRVVFPAWRFHAVSS